MRVIQINATCGVGSTGKIAVAISELLSKRGIENKILYSSATNGYPLGVECCGRKYTKVQSLKAKVVGNYGFNSQIETGRIIAELERFLPDIVLLHNIHSHDCHLERLFNYFKENRIKLFWTFHDCWAFTGYCVYFTFDKCDRWKTGCHHCQQRKKYSWFFDRSKVLYRKKKQLFSNLDLTIVTPSHWMADLVKQSFLKDYPVKVIHNGIDLSVFQPTPGNFRERHHISNENFVLLGVAFDWEKRKGLDVFVDLSKKLDPEKYRIVLVGTDDSVDKQLPDNIISIHRTQNQKELAEIYTAADLFVNPTREENYPTVNMESIACGTPVLTFRTGGSPEIVDVATGAVVASDDVEAMARQIITIQEENPFSSEACLEQAKKFDKDLRFKEYIRLLIGE